MPNPKEILIRGARRGLPTSTVILLLFSSYARRNPDQFAWLKRFRSFYLFLIILNWRNLPLIWHIRCFIFIPILRARLQLLRWGIDVGKNQESRAKELGLPLVDSAFVQIGKSPWDVIILTKESVGFGKSFHYHAHGRANTTCSRGRL